MRYDPILVSGAGRSGTSAVAGILHHAGVFMGYRFFTGREGNPKGYWEDYDFLHFHMGANNPINTDEWYEEREKLIKDRQDLEWPWGFKDPRIASYLDMYQELFDNPKLIWCKRNLDDITRSIWWQQQRGWEKDIEKEDCPQEHLDKMRTSGAFYTRNEQMKEGVNQYKHSYTIEFDELIHNNTEGTIKNLLEFCGVPVSEFTMRRLVDFIKLPYEECAKKGLAPTY